MIYSRINVQDYKECQDDVQAASAMMDDIRDAVIDYQVGGYEPYTVFASPNWITLTDGPATGDI